MRTRLIVTWLCSLGFLLVGVADLVAQNPPSSAAVAQADPTDLKLVGNRFPPLTWAQLTEQQKTMMRNVLDGPRTAPNGPFNVMLRAPLMGDFAQELGAQVRFNSSLQPNEAALHRFCSELLETKHVGDDTFAVMKTAFGEQGMAEVIFTLGYYSLVSMLLNVDEHPLPNGVAPELKPLSN